VDAKRYRHLLWRARQLREAAGEHADEIWEASKAPSVPPPKPTNLSQGFIERFSNRRKSEVDFTLFTARALELNSTLPSENQRVKQLAREFETTERHVRRLFKQSTDFTK
jgi:hypothetical protein